MAFYFAAIGSLVSMSFISLSDSKKMTFKPVNYLNGSHLCAVDAPSMTVAIGDIAFAPFSGIPYAVRCSYYCTELAAVNITGCVGFNYQCDDMECDFYSTMPRHCTYRRNCLYYSVSCRRTVSRPS